MVEMMYLLLLVVFVKMETRTTTITILTGRAITIAVKLSADHPQVRLVMKKCPRNAAITKTTIADTGLAAGGVRFPTQKDVRRL